MFVCVCVSLASSSHLPIKDCADAESYCANTILAIMKSKESCFILYLILMGLLVVHQNTHCAYCATLKQAHPQTAAHTHTHWPTHGRSHVRRSIHRCWCLKGHNNNIVKSRAAHECRRTFAFHEPIYRIAEHCPNCFPTALSNAYFSYTFLLLSTKISLTAMSISSSSNRVISVFISLIASVEMRWARRWQCRMAILIQNGAAHERWPAGVSAART